MISEHRLTFLFGQQNSQTVSTLATNRHRIRKLFIKLACIASILCILTQQSYAKLQSKITTYPIATTILNQFSDAFGRKSKKYIAPLIVESVGNQSLNSFCSSEDTATDIYVTHQKMSPEDFSICQKAGVTNLIELKLGYGAIVVIASEDLNIKNITQQELYLAITKFWYQNNTIIENNSDTWQDIAISNEALPATPIHILAPSADTKLRDIFEDRILVSGCKARPDIHAIKFQKPKLYRDLCLSIRTDNHLEELNLSSIGTTASELLVKNKNFITFAPPSTLLRPELAQNIVSINNFTPTIENIIEDNYPLSAPIYMYAKQSSLNNNKGLKNFLKYMFSEQNDNNALLDAAGFIPLTPLEMTEQFNVIISGQSNYMLDQITSPPIESTAIIEQQQSQHADISIETQPSIPSPPNPEQDLGTAAEFPAIESDNNHQDPTESSQADQLSLENDINPPISQDGTDTEISQEVDNYPFLEN